MWNLITELWNTVLLEPIFNLIALLISLVPGHNFGVALILFTLLLRTVMHPVTKKYMRYIKKQKELQPEVLKIKKANKNNRQKEAMEIMALYKKRGFNPFAAIGYLLIQLPVFIALYQVIRRVAGDSQSLAADSYGFVQNLAWVKDLSVNPGIFDPTMLGVVDLTRPALGDEGFYFGAFVIAVLAALAQFLLSKQMSGYNDKGKRPKKLKELFRDQAAGKEVDQSEISAAASRTLIYILPGVILVFSLGWFAALPFYWFTSGVMQYFQQKHLNNQDGKNAVKAVVNGYDTMATFEKPLNAKQKKEQARRSFYGRTGSKRVSATAKTINKKNKQQGD